MNHETFTTALLGNVNALACGLFLLTAFGIMTTRQARGWGRWREPLE